MYGNSTFRPAVNGLRLIAVFEASKGLLVLLAGFGLLSLVHRNVQVLAGELVGHTFLVHHVRVSGVLLHAAANLTDGQLRNLALLALVYSTVRFTEAYGLWRKRVWGEWFALLSGLIYLPWEIRALHHHPTETHFLLVGFNAMLVAYLIRVRSKNMRAQPDEQYIG